MKFARYFLYIISILCGAYYFYFSFYNKPYLSVPIHKESKRKLAGTHQSSYTLYTESFREHSKKLIQRGRKLHQQQNYPLANKVLAELVHQYPYTGYIEEASFLLAKGLFIEGKWHASEEVIMRLKGYEYQTDSKWRGHALLVLAQIYAKRNKTDQAIQLCRLVIKDFSEHGSVVRSAHALLDQIIIL